MAYPPQAYTHDAAYMLPPTNGLTPYPMPVGQPPNSASAQHHHSFPFQPQRQLQPSPKRGSAAKTAKALTDLEKLRLLKEEIVSGKHLIYKLPPGAKIDLPAAFLAEPVTVPAEVVDAVNSVSSASLTDPTLSSTAANSQTPSGSRLLDRLGDAPSNAIDPRGSLGPASPPGRSHPLLRHHSGDSISFGMHKVSKAAVADDRNGDAYRSANSEARLDIDRSNEERGLQNRLSDERDSRLRRNRDSPEPKRQRQSSYEARDRRALSPLRLPKRRRLSPPLASSAYPRTAVDYSKPASSMPQGRRASLSPPRNRPIIHRTSQNNDFSSVSANFRRPRSPSPDYRLSRRARSRSLDRPRYRSHSPGVGPRAFRAPERARSPPFRPPDRRRSPDMSQIKSEQGRRVSDRPLITEDITSRGRSRSRSPFERAMPLRRLSVPHSDARQMPAPLSRESDGRNGQANPSLMPQTNGSFTEPPVHKGRDENVAALSSGPPHAMQDVSVDKQGVQNLGERLGAQPPDNLDVKPVIAASPRPNSSTLPPSNLPPISFNQMHAEAHRGGDGVAQSQGPATPMPPLHATQIPTPYAHGAPTSMPYPYPHPPQQPDRQYAQAYGEAGPSRPPYYPIPDPGYNVPPPGARYDHYGYDARERLPYPPTPSAYPDQAYREAEYRRPPPLVEHYRGIPRDGRDTFAERSAYEDPRYRVPPSDDPPRYAVPPHQGYYDAREARPYPDDRYGRPYPLQTAPPPPITPSSAYPGYERRNPPPSQYADRAYYERQGPYPEAGAGYQHDRSMSGQHRPPADYYPPAYHPYTRPPGAANGDEYRQAYYDRSAYPPSANDARAYPGPPSQQIQRSSEDWFPR